MDIRNKNIISFFGTELLPLYPEQRVSKMSKGIPFLGPTSYK
jgi:hypothetical protein